jgi:4-azaleucine resistance transporter AzlC
MSAPVPSGETVRASRRELTVGAIAIGVSGLGFGFVYGLAAREAGFSPIEAQAMSLLVFAGAAQFAAVGYVASGLAWPGVILLTALLNARHLLYSAALAPWLRDTPRGLRAVMAHVLTDEAFALSIAHFGRIGIADVRGYWIAAIVADLIPWNVATFAGATLGGSIPDPARFGLDVVFPASMVGLAVGLVTGRRELVAALGGAVLGVAGGLAVDPAVGVLLGGLGGPLLAMLVPRAAGDDRAALGTTASAERYGMPGAQFVHEPGRRQRGEPRDSLAREDPP